MYTFDYSNDFDCMKKGDEVIELTVTITLNEYRYLIEQNATKDFKLDSLKTRLSAQEEENKKLKEAIALIKMPEITDAIKNLTRAIFSDAEETECAEVTEIWAAETEE